jgi:branched-chain amino acid transport system permease protein
MRLTGPQRLGLLGAVALAVILSLLLKARIPLVDDWVFRGTLLVMIAISWNMMANAGLLSLGQSAFWGLGGYACVLAVNDAGLGFWTSFPVALLAAGIAGALLALTTGRLSGMFFAIATLALSEGLRVLANMIPSVTAGSAGIYLASTAVPPRWLLYQVAVLSACATIAISVLLSATRFAFAIRAMRNNENAAQMLGVNPLLYRTGISILAGMIAGFAGCLNMWYGQYITPEIAFDLNYAILAQIAVIIGGIYTLSGPVVGAVVIVFLSEATRILFGGQEGYSVLIYGLCLALSILYMPKGLHGALRRVLGTVRQDVVS